MLQEPHVGIRMVKPFQLGLASERKAVKLISPPDDQLSRLVWFGGLPSAPSGAPSSLERVFYYCNTNTQVVGLGGG